MPMRLSVMYKNGAKSEIFKHVTSFELVEGYLVAYHDFGKKEAQRPNVQRVSVSEEQGDEYDNE